MSDGDPCVRVVDAAPIERFVRLNGAVVVRTTGDPPRWLVNGRVVLDESGLLTMANMKRRRAGLPPFAWAAGPAQAAPTAAAPPQMTDAPTTRRPRRRTEVRPTPSPARLEDELTRVKLLAADLALQLHARDGS